VVTALGSLALHNAELYGDKPAFVAGGDAVSFREHNARVNRLVDALLARGIAPGDRIAVLARNCLPYLDLYGVAEKSGIVLAPVNFRLTPSELTKVLLGIQPRVLFVQEAYAEAIEAIRGELPPMELVLLDGGDREGWTAFEPLLALGSDAEPDCAVAPDDVCYLISTSGTTGVPRSAMLTHRGQWANAVATALELRLVPSDRHLAMMPLFHIGGWADVLAHTLRGCTVVLHDGFDTGAVLRDIERERITTIQVVPTMIAWLLNHPDLERHDRSSLRLVFYASAPMPVELLRRALDRFGPVFTQAYGQTESGPLVTTLQMEDHSLDAGSVERLASCGRAVPGVRIRILGDDGTELPRGSVGEVAVRSDSLMTGYWRDPAASRAALRDGWLHTGDMGRLDAEGYLYLVDRKKDMIITGGENVFPREVEEVLYAHPAVIEAAVIGAPDETWGDRVTAVVVRRAGHDVGGDELVAFCRERLAGYKCPKTVEFRDELPKNPSGKVLKRELREQAAAGAGPAAG
jgi:long-chain acyl-CoA synthetase